VYRKGKRKGKKILEKNSDMERRLYRRGKRKGNSKKKKCFILMWRRELRLEEQWRQVQRLGEQAWEEASEIMRQEAGGRAGGRSGYSTPRG
jgi:hypothetical protein